jgi:hypothetical protein
MYVFDGIGVVANGAAKAIGAPVKARHPTTKALVVNFIVFSVSARSSATRTKQTMAPRAHCAIDDFDGRTSNNHAVERDDHEIQWIANSRLLSCGLSVNFFDASPQASQPPKAAAHAQLRRHSLTRCDLLAGGSNAGVSPIPSRPLDHLVADRTVHRDTTASRAGPSAFIEAETSPL